jgi:drug/metabolite transporter (DMT)-like permease
VLSGASGAAFFTRRRNVVLLATLCCLLWGSAYPAIKSGYALLSIGRDDTASQLVFAGWRFVLAGLLLLGMARAMGRPVLALSRGDLGRITLLGLTQTSLQYVFFYVGLAHTTGVRASILNATGTFFSVLIAHFIFHNDRLDRRKTLGCLVGFAGVMVVNLRGGGQGLDASFTLLGDGFIVIAAFVLSAASIYGKRLSQQIDAMVMTAYQLAIGGLALSLAGHITGGALQGMGVAAASLLLYMAILSAVAFALWAALLKHNRVGMVSVFNFLIPVFGALLSALFLGEQILAWRNAVALLLVCGGIWLVTSDRQPAPSAATPAG